MGHTKGQAFVPALAPFEQPCFNLQHDRAIRTLLYSDYANDDVYLDNLELYSGGPSNKHLDYIIIDNGAEVPFGFFCNKQYETISAVIFNCNATWGKVVALANKNNPNGQIISTWDAPPKGQPTYIICKSSEYKENILDGLIIFHNPYAKNPPSPCVFRGDRVVQFFPDYKSMTLLEENYNNFLHSKNVIITNYKDTDLR